MPLIAPDEHVEAREPVEGALHAGQHIVAHVGEDGGEQAALLELQLPGEHGGVLRGPHAGVQSAELFDGAGGEVEAGFAHDLLPEGDAGEFAFVVGVTVGPVEALETGRRQAGDAQHGCVGFRVRWTG